MELLINIAAACGAIILLVFTVSLVLTFIGAVLMFVGSILGGGKR
jgi:hypothetical protein